MKTYIGSKIIDAKPMTRGEYNEYRGWTQPAGEDQADAGYLVEYRDGGAGNDSRHLGYISWSPKGVFDAAYRRTDAMTFGDALVFLKQGKAVARAGWNGKGMWLGLHEEGGTFVREACGTTIEYAPYIVMKTADNKLVPWLASQTDMLAEDWVALPPAK